MRIKYASTTMGGTSLRSMHQGLSKVAPMSLQRRACRGGRRSRRHPCRSFEFGGDNIAVVLHLLEQAPELLLGHACDREPHRVGPWPSRTLNDPGVVGLKELGDFTSGRARNEGQVQVDT